MESNAVNFAANGFAHLHVHTDRAHLGEVSAVRVDELCRRAKELGMGAVAVADLWDMGAHRAFRDAARRAGIKPVFGVDVLVETASLLQTPRSCIPYSHAPREKTGVLTLLAKDIFGYRKLMRLVSDVRCNADPGSPLCADVRDLERVASGVVAIAPWRNGAISTFVQCGKMPLAQEAACTLSRIFGDDFYLGLAATGLPVSKSDAPAQERVRTELRMLAEKLDVQTAAENLVCYLQRDEFVAQDALQCDLYHETLGGRGVARSTCWEFLDGDQYYLKSPGEMREAYAGHDSELETAAQIAASCNVELVDTAPLPPACPLAHDGESDEEALRRLSQAGFARRYGSAPCAGAKARLAEELEILGEKGWARHILVLAELAAWARDADVQLCCMGDEYAASLVAYALGITQVDPVKYGLDRNASPAYLRGYYEQSYPTMSVTIESAHREEAIEHLRAVYGDEHVADALDIVRFGANRALEAACNVLGYSKAMLKDRLGPLPVMSPTEAQGTIAQWLQQRLGRIPDPDIRAMVDCADMLRNHVAYSRCDCDAIVLSAHPICKTTPLSKLWRGGRWHAAAQLTARESERAGLTVLYLKTVRKADVGIIPTLDMLGECLRIAGDALDFGTQFDERDPAIYELLRGSATTGVVTDSMAKKFREAPRLACIEDIASAMVTANGKPKRDGLSQALVVAQLAWLKAHYPCEFYAAVLALRPARVGLVRRELKLGGSSIELLCPDINTSGRDCTVEDGNLRLGLASAGADDSFSKAYYAGKIIAERERNGSFAGLFDFAGRMCDTLHDAHIRALVSGGAFDSTDGDADELLKRIERDNLLVRARLFAYGRSRGANVFESLAP